MGEADDSYHASPQENAEAMRVHVLSILPTDIALMFSHQRLDEPLREVLLDLASHGLLSGPDGGTGALADEAQKQVLAASAVRASLPPGGPQNALGLVMRAWTALEEACLFGGEELF